MCNKRLYKLIYRPSKQLRGKSVLARTRFDMPKHTPWKIWFDGEVVSEDFMNARE